MWQAVNQTGSAEFSNRKGCGQTNMLTSVTSTKTLFKPQASRQTVPQYSGSLRLSQHSDFKSSS